LIKEEGAENLEKEKKPAEDGLWGGESRGRISGNLRVRNPGYRV